MALRTQEAWRPRGLRNWAVEDWRLGVWENWRVEELGRRADIGDTGIGALEMA